MQRPLTSGTKVKHTSQEYTKSVIIPLLFNTRNWNDIEDDVEILIKHLT